MTGVLLLTYHCLCFRGKPLNIAAKETYAKDEQDEDQEDDKTIITITSSAITFGFKIRHLISLLSYLGVSYPVSGSGFLDKSHRKRQFSHRYIIFLDLDIGYACYEKLVTLH